MQTGALYINSMWREISDINLFIFGRCSLIIDNNSAAFVASHNGDHVPSTIIYYAYSHSSGNHLTRQDSI